MRWAAFAIVLLSVLCLLKQAEGDPEAIEEIISSMKNSFGALSSKREQWYDNYSHMKKHSDADKVQLAELLLVSKLAIPMIWQLYTTEVVRQKKDFPKLVKEQVDQYLPYHKTFPLQFPLYHVEMTMQLQEESNFQIEILSDDTLKMFLLQVNYEDRRLVFSDQNEGGEIIERLVIQDEAFPPIQPGQDFRVNIQVADDCLFTSFWVGDLTMAVPMPLPTKHHWCSKIYRHASLYTINVMDTPQASLEASEELQSSEETSPVDVKMVSIAVYAGLLVQ